MEEVLSKERQEKWDKRFMDVAKLVGTWCTCHRHSVGSVIVKNRRIIATGYNGAPTDVDNCLERGECLRNKLQIASGTRAEMCYAVHAEQNAIAQAAKLGSSVDGATIYVTHQPCTTCTKLIINSGIKRIVFGIKYKPKKGCFCRYKFLHKNCSRCWFWENKGFDFKNCKSCEKRS